MRGSCPFKVLACATIEPDMSHTTRPTGVENLLGEEELIVSKTDLKGRITYANEVFVRMAKYSSRN